MYSCMSSMMMYLPNTWVNCSLWKLTFTFSKIVNLIKTDITELIDEDHLQEHIDEEIKFLAEDGQITINPEPEPDDDWER